MAVECSRRPRTDLHGESRMKPFAHRSTMLVVMAVLLSAAPVLANPWNDSPPMRWPEMAKCELIVLAHYDSCQGGKVRLTVQRALKGTAKPGDVLSVAIKKDTYTIETGRVWPLLGGPATEPDGVPKLCYKTCAWIITADPPTQVVPDCRKDELYFFPKAAAPALDRIGQVEPAFLAGDWQRVLDGKPPSLLFRLLPHTSVRDRREALEELYANRDPKTIEQLFDWVLIDPLRGYEFSNDNFSPGDILAAIGDKDGSLYTRLMKVFTDNARGQGADAQARAGQALVWLDPGRATKDLSDLIRNDGGLRIPAIQALGNGGGEQAAGRLIELLSQKDPVGGEAIKALAAACNSYSWSAYRFLLKPTIVQTAVRNLYPRHGWSAAQQDRLRAWVVAELGRAMTQPDIPSRRKEQINEHWEICRPDATLPRPAVIGPREMKELLNPAAGAYAGITCMMPPPGAEEMGQGRASEILRAMAYRPDPSFIPVLIRVWKENPAAKGGGGFGGGELFRVALDAQVCEFPKDALDALGKAQLIDRSKDSGMPAFDAFWQVDTLLRGGPWEPRLVALAKFPGGAEWLASHKPTKSMVDELVEDLRPGLKTGFNGQWSDLLLEWLDALMTYAPDQGEPLLKDALAGLDKFAHYDKGVVLAIAIRHGRHELAKNLIEVIHEWENEVHSVPSEYDNLLPWSRDKAAVLEHVKRLDRQEKTTTDYHTRDEAPNIYYAYLLNGLAPDHLADFVPRVIRLLESDSLAERSMGQEALTKGVGWDFGFDPTAFAQPRAERLKVIRPQLEKLAATPANKIGEYIGSIRHQ